MRTAGHISETTLDISSVLRMDMNGQKTFSSVCPNSQPTESGFAVFVIFSLAAVGLKNCCLLQCAGCQLPVVAYSLTLLLHLFPKEGVSQYKMLLSTGIMGILQFGSCTKTTPAGLILCPSDPRCEPKVHRKWNVSELEPLPSVNLRDS